MKTNFIPSMVFCLIVSLLLACSSDKEDGKNDYGNAEDGYALKKADGHSFQFYNSTKWLFSVAVNNGKIYPSFQEGRVPTGVPVFDYERTGKNEAECWVSVLYNYALAGGNHSGGYIARLKLTFTSPTQGTYRTYDVVSGEFGSTGKFTIDSKSNDPDNPDEPDTPVIPDEPDTPQIPANLIESTITKVYPNRIMVDFTYDPSFSKEIKQTGHCWSTNPHPTVLDSSVKNILNSDKKSGTAQCDLKETPGTTYYVRAYAQVGTDFIYFNEMKVQSVGGEIQLSVYYSKDEDKIAVDYNINKTGTFELCFFAALTSGVGRYVDDSLGFISKGKGKKFVTDYYCFYYYAYLKETSTGIKYYSDEVTKPF